jgi:hypothetical protein
MLPTVSIRKSDVLFVRKVDSSSPKPKSPVLRTSPPDPVAEPVVPADGPRSGSGVLNNRIA